MKDDCIDKSSILNTSEIVVAKSLFGILPKTLTLEKAMEEKGKNMKAVDYTEWQRTYFDAKSPAEISHEASQYEKYHPFKGNAVRLSHRLNPDDSDPVA